MDAKRLRLETGEQCYRERGPHDQSGGPTLVLLHGISSSAGSWARLAERLPGYRLLAWDAPGYGDSHPLANEAPTAADYAERLEAWLAALGVERCVLVGHSLGAMMAAGYLAAHPGRLAGVVLADPAQGYGEAEPARRDEVYRSRWTQLEAQGHAAYARARAPRLLREGADPADIARVEAEMHKLHVEGFAQAGWMLANDSLGRYLAATPAVPALVICGDEDRITPPEDARALARRLALPYRDIPRAGHASYIDAPAAFARAIDDFARPLLGAVDSSATP
ncbi:alpha/beta fold hydrolase [Halomonas heilongjiangensis]|uniref:Alpha/beta hydrolase n=1 Tax=Halomonas heilongjiangensis TaxID=1387883 RepID=A0A2N7TNG2_9GAMM|nr:alpha/beta hydrolase [Halomonas heilongjiangensis]PMR69712.1 alpha/beta hydrolase [Halomonas heilongjiangensis]PXX93078.1 alpha/beta hydrolase [Halomonas heilongjiangensis]